MKAFLYFSKISLLYNNSPSIYLCYVLCLNIGHKFRTALFWHQILKGSWFPSSPPTAFMYFVPDGADIQRWKTKQQKKKQCVVRQGWSWEEWKKRWDSRSSGVISASQESYSQRSKVANRLVPEQISHKDQGEGGAGSEAENALKEVDCELKTKEKNGLWKVTPLQRLKPNKTKGGRENTQRKKEKLVKHLSCFRSALHSNDRIWWTFF